MPLRNPRVAGHNILALSEGGRVVRLLQARGIEVIVLKGAALTETVYAVDERLMADIDVLVPSAQGRDADEVLEAAGIRRIRVPARPIGAKRHFASGYMTPMNVAIDIHTHFAQQGRWPIDYRAVFARRVPLTLDRTETSRLSNEDALLYLALNQAKDEYSTDGRVVEDVRRVVHALGVDWDVLIRRAREWRCTVPMWLTLAHARECASLEVPGRVEAALEPTWARRAYLLRLLDLGRVPPYRYAAHGRRTRQLLLSAALTDVAWRHAWTVARFSVLRTADWLFSRRELRERR